jgi:hypothetical protein
LAFDKKLRHQKKTCLVVYPKRLNDSTTQQINCSGCKEAKTIYIFSTNQQINKSTLLCRSFEEGEYVKGECDGGEVVTGDL